MSLSRKRAVVLGALIAVVAAAAAYAYWTSTGSGTGTASTKTPTGSVDAVQTSTITNMYPGDSPQTLSGKFNNTTGGPAYVTKVVVSIAGVTGGAGACDGTDYTLTGATMNVGAEVPAGNNQGAWSGATIQFNNKASNQDGCKGATVNLSYAVS
jgi:hypothetical protein